MTNPTRLAVVLRVGLAASLIIQLTACSDDAGSGPQGDADAADVQGDGDAGGNPDVGDDLPDGQDMGQDLASDGGDDAGDDAGDAGDGGDDAGDGGSDAGDGGDDTGDGGNDADVADAADLPDGGDAFDLADGGDAGDLTDAFDAPDLGDLPDGSGTGVEVLCRELTPPSSGTCEVTPGNELLLVRGTILAGDVFVGGEVLVDGAGAIVCAGCDCSAASAGATVVECAEGVVSPGLINAHDHINWLAESPDEPSSERFDHRNDWGDGFRGHTDLPVVPSSDDDGLFWGELRQVMSGTTSIFASGDSAGLLRNLDQVDGREGLVGPYPDYDSFPLETFVASVLKSADCDYPELPTPGDFPFVPHAAEGIDPEARNEFLCMSSSARGGVDVTDASGGFIHMIAARAIDGAELAAEGASVVWSPRTNVALYGHTAPVPMLATQGVNIGLGTDWTLSGSATIVRELACADYLNEVHYGGFFSDRELWLIATEQGARALGVEGEIGAIRSGLVADLAIYAEGEADTPYRAVIDATADGVVLVLRGGDVLYGDAELVEALTGGTSCDLVDFQGGDVCGVDKRACVQAEVGRSLAALQAANTGNYGLFWCGVPEGEPTCVPSRPGEYDGSTSIDDSDGDGIDDITDNCATVFNPPRPVDRFVQADFDGDGLGDVCDPCPLDPDTTTCSPYDPTDRDNDGETDTGDNCPDDFNPLQDDSDSDDIGDACDVCPEQSNEGGVPCVSSIYDIKLSRVPVETELTVRGIVTAVDGNDFFIQVAPDEQDPELGATYSGLLVFVGSNEAGVIIPSRGDIVEVTGTNGIFFNIFEFQDVTDVFVESSGNVMPEAETFAAAEAPYGSERARALEGILVETQGDVESPYANASSGLEALRLVGGLRVDDRFYHITPEPLVADELTITGVFRHDFDTSRLSPRDVDDVLRTAGPPRLASVEPALTYLADDETDVETHPPLVVTIDRPAPAEGTTVTVTSANEDVVTVTNVTIDEGETTATLTATGELASENPVTITFDIEGDVDAPLTSSIRVVPASRSPEVESIEPPSSFVVLDSSTTLTIELDLPVDTTPFTLDVTADPDSAVTITGPGAFAEWDTSGTIEVQGDELGEVTITAAVEGSDVSASATITVVDEAPVGQLAFFDFDGETRSPTATADNVTVSDMSLASGETPDYFNDESDGDAIATNGWNENDQYFEFSVEENSGGQVGATEFSFAHRASGTGPTQWEVHLVSGEASTVVASGATGTSFDTSTFDIDLDDQGPYSGTLRVRIVGLEASASGGTWRIDNVELTGYAF